MGASTFALGCRSSKSGEVVERESVPPPRRQVGGASARSDSGADVVRRVRILGHEVTWLGFSTVMLKLSDGRCLLIDPWLSFSGCPIKVDDIERLDAILISHGHWQHVGDAALLHKKTKAPVIAVEEVSAWLRGQGVTAAPKVNLGGTIDVAGLRISLTKASHSSGLLESESGYISYGGDPAGFVVHLPGDVRIYHAGDTDVFSDMMLIRQRFAPQIGFLPIGDVTTMGPEGAAMAAELLGLQVVIPMHYDLPEFTGTPEAFRYALQTRQIDADVRILSPGESLT